MSRVVLPSDSSQNSMILLPYRASTSRCLTRKSLSQFATVHVPIPSIVSNVSSADPGKDPPLALDYSTPLRIIDVVIAEKPPEAALLDDGSEICVIRADFASELGVDVNKHRTMLMETANGAKEQLPGCAFVVPNAPYRILLGRPWQRGVRLQKWETEDGVSIRIWGQKEEFRQSRIVVTKERVRPAAQAYGISCM
ncbi:hypothetical protein BDZ89DRAFT_1076007, partial [Hymenopellis radicata]